MIFICSPNNPTGNLMDRKQVELLLKRFKGLVIVDEAYIDFAAPGASMLDLLKKHERLVVLQTFSKAWGMAGLRIGMAMASPAIIEVMNKVKAPYNIGTLAQEYAVRALRNQKWIHSWTRETIAQREMLREALAAFPFVVQVFPSEANFLLVRVTAAAALYNYLLKKGIVVRNRATVRGCEECLRITVGSQEENEQLLSALETFSRSAI